MNSSLPNAQPSDPVRSLDNIRPQSVKAGLLSDAIGPSLIAVTIDAVRTYYGSVKATAYALGEGAHRPRLDESLMMREFKAGNFARLEYADAKAKAAIADAYVEAFGALSNPLDYALRSLDSIDSEVKALRQFVLLGRTA